MKKFERKTGGNISSIVNNVTPGEHEASLLMLKEAEARLKAIVDARKKQDVEGIRLDKLPMASSEGMEQINIHNAHIYHSEETGPVESTHKTR